MALVGLQAALLQEREDVLRELDVEGLQRSRARLHAQFKVPKSPKSPKPAASFAVRRSTRQPGGSPPTGSALELDGDWSDGSDFGDHRPRKRRGVSGQRGISTNSLGPRGVHPRLRSLLDTCAGMCLVQYDGSKKFDNKEYVQPVTCGFCRQCTT